MRYLRSDIERLHISVPHLSFAIPRRALQFFNEVTQTGAELADTLSRYPDVRYEPLDFHYICLQSLGALNEQVLNDLLTEHGWRGILWGALLVCLSPDARYRPILEAASGKAPYQQWAVDLALAMLEGTTWSGDLALQQALARLSSQLARLALPVVRLRELSPLEMQLRLQQSVRETYHQAGLEAALKVLAAAEASPNRNSRPG